LYHEHVLAGTEHADGGEGLDMVQLAQRHVSLAVDASQFDAPVLRGELDQHRLLRGRPHRLQHLMRESVSVDT
jgi:hypothetical protein